jgi:UDP-N-acetylglucosamine:LPS N-acetylglucosamine transferase
MNKKLPKIILLAGKTGGPIIPLIAIDSNLPDHETIVFGVKGGFEEEITKSRNFKLIYLPEAKLNLFSFRNPSCLKLFLEFLIQFGIYF